jgi:hypothetical protein
MQDIEVELNDKTFVITPFGARQGVALEARILAILGPGVNGLKEVLSGFDIKAGMDQKVDLGFVATATTEIIQSVMEKDPELNIVFALLKKTFFVKDGQKVSLNSDEVLDGLFSGKTDELFNLAFKVAKANGFFIGKLTGLLDLLMTKPEPLTNTAS